MAKFDIHGVNLSTDVMADSNDFSPIPHAVADFISRNIQIARGKQITRSMLIQRLKNSYTVVPAESACDIVLKCFDCKNTITNYELIKNDVLIYVENHCVRGDYVCCLQLLFTNFCALYSHIKIREFTYQLQCMGFEVEDDKTVKGIIPTVTSIEVFISSVRRPCLVIFDDFYHQYSVYCEKNKAVLFGKSTFAARLICCGLMRGYTVMLR